MTAEARQLVNYVSSAFSSLTLEPYPFLPYPCLTFYCDQFLKHWGWGGVFFSFCLFATHPNFWSLTFLLLKPNSQQLLNKQFHFSLTFNIFAFSITSEFIEFAVHILLLTVLDSLKVVSKCLTPNESCYCQRLPGLWREKQTRLCVFLRALSETVLQGHRLTQLSSQPQYLWHTYLSWVLLINSFPLTSV